MYLKPFNASPGRRVPDAEAQDAAQAMADKEQCRVLICREMPMGATLPVGSAEPVADAEVAEPESVAYFSNAELSGPKTAAPAAAPARKKRKRSQ